MINKQKLIKLPRKEISSGVLLTDREAEQESAEFLKTKGYVIGRLQSTPSLTLSVFECKWCS